MLLECDKVFLMNSRDRIRNEINRFLFNVQFAGQEKSVCRDELIVSDDRTNLLSTCGDHSSAVAVLSLSHQVNVTLVPQSRMVFPKRGFLLYFRGEFSKTLSIYFAL